MLFDHRTYRCKPGTVPAQMALYQEHGREPQERALGQPLFYGITETGPVNTYIHVWQYENAADREARRAAMQADPAWQAFMKISREAGYLVSQDNQLMTPAPHFTPRG